MQPAGTQKAISLTLRPVADEAGMLSVLMAIGGLTNRSPIEDGSVLMGC
jgi:hypothetical protein